MDACLYARFHALPLLRNNDDAVIKMPPELMAGCWGSGEVKVGSERAAPFPGPHIARDAVAGISPLFIWDRGEKSATAWTR